MSYNQSPTLTGAAQTMAAWSKVLESRSAIPAVYQPYFDHRFSREDDFPQVILTPALDKFPRRTTEKLICATDEVIHIFERQADRVVPSAFYYPDICSVELGIILLDTWLTLRGTTSDGEAVASTIEINTTSLRYFSNILKKLRPAVSGSEAAAETEKDKFNDLKTRNFKFMNYGRESLTAGETVLQILLQPELREPSWSLLGKTFYKTISLAHLTVLTDRELILIQDAQRKAEFRKFEYGGTWQYIPLRCIDSIQFSKTPQERVMLSILVQPNQTIDKLFETSQVPALEQLCARFQELIRQPTAT